MKKLLLITLIAVAATALFANGLSLNSIGPRSLGMGGAYVGLADDATAIYWNPAGLASQSNSVTLFGSDVIPFATYKYDAYGIDAKTKTNNYISPNLFLNYNMDKLSLGFGAYVPAGLGAEWNGDDLVAFSGPAQIPTSDTTFVTNPFAGKSFEWMSELGVFDFSPAVAYKINDKVSFGVAGNIYYGMMKMDRPQDMLNIMGGTPAPGEDHMMDTQTMVDISGMGYGATIGVKWQCLLSDKINMGLTYKTPITVKFSGTMDIQMAGVGEKDMDMDITWPMWIAYGASFKPCALTTINFDAQYTNWKALDKLVAKIKDMPMADGTMGTMEEDMVMNWEDAIQIRFGIERKINDMVALRLGYYYDPAPAPDETLNIIFPSSTNNVVTTGFGLTFDKLTVDYGMEYLLGAEREVTQTATNMAGVHQMDVFAFSFGLGYHF